MISSHSQKCKIPSLFYIENGADPTIETDAGYNSMDLAVALGYRSGEYCKCKPFKKINFCSSSIM